MLAVQSFRIGYVRVWGWNVVILDAQINEYSIVYILY